jgi:hypothetical protein
MRCRSCSENIDAKYRHALANNVCPICGQKLLSDALFNLRIKVTHILETHEVLTDKIDVISTDIMNTIIRSFTEDKAVHSQPTTEQKKALATQDKQLVKFGSPDGGEVEENFNEDGEIVPREFGEDDPNNPENKEFLKDIGWDEEHTSAMKDTVKPKISPIVKRLPNPISRLS